jgi:TolB-like protein/Flp pilus assembly protein TadD
LRKEREERYQTAEELLGDLKSLQEELEFEAKLGRSTRPESSAVRQAITGDLEYLITAVRDHKFAFAALALLLLALVSVGLYRLAGLGQVKAIESLAVLPFVNETADPNTEHLSDGITESLINRLSQLAKLRVLARGTVFRYKGRHLDPQKAGRALKVQAVLTGRVLQRGDTLVIKAELIDIARGAQLWGEQYNRKLADILAIEGEIAREISDRIRLQLSGLERERLTKRYTENPEAYNLYKLGRFQLAKRTPEGLKKGTEYLEQAVRKDPAYGLAYADLADAYLLLMVYRVVAPQDVNEKLKAAVFDALKIDESLAEARIALAAAKNRDNDWAGAEQEYRRALDLNPNYSMAYQRYALLLSSLGRFDEALAEIERARNLDPASLIINSNVGEVLYYARRYEEAIEPLRKTLEMDPSFRQAYIGLALCYTQINRFPEAVAELQKALSLSRDAAVLSDLGYVYAVSGDRAGAQKVLDEMRELSRRSYVSPLDIAMIHVGLGNRDEAIELLNHAYEERSPQLRNLKVDPWLDSLRADPRFQDLLKRKGLAL